MSIRSVVILLFAGLLSAVPSMAMDVVPTASTASEHVSVDACHWKTFTSKEHGFEIKYPQDFALQREISLDVVEGPVLQLLLVNPVYCDRTNLAEASVFVGVEPENACSSLLATDFPQDSSGGGDVEETRYISGVSFSMNSSSEGAVGNQYSLTTYSAMHKGSCYRLALFAHSINVEVYDPGTVFEFDKAALFRIFDQVISTFRFLK